MNLPNILTLLRIVLVPIFFSFLITPFSENPNARFYASFCLIAAALTDVLDGFFARSLRQQTEIGALLDPIADKLIVISGFLGILLTSQAVFKPLLGVQVMIIFREIMIALGFLIVFLFSRKIDFHPNWLGKMTNGLQLSLILFCIYDWPGAMGLSYVTVAVTVASGLVYTVQELRKFS